MYIYLYIICSNSTGALYQHIPKERRPFYYGVDFSKVAVENAKKTTGIYLKNKYFLLVLPLCKGTSYSSYIHTYLLKKVKIQTCKIKIISNRLYLVYKALCN